MAATSSRIAGRKEGEIKVLAAHRGYPVIYLGEAGGAPMPDIMGSAGLASFGVGGFDTYLKIMSRVRQTPMITAILGECYGMPTWMACLSDFVVQLKGSAMGVSGPRVVASRRGFLEQTNPVPGLADLRRDRPALAGLGIAGFLLGAVLSVALAAGIAAAAGGLSRAKPLIDAMYSAGVGAGMPLAAVGFALALIGAATRAAQSEGSTVVGSGVGVGVGVGSQAGDTVTSTGASNSESV